MSLETPFDEPRFHALADRTLNAFLDAIDTALGDALDVDIQDDVLTIECPGGRQYILNKNAPLRQLWLSSPQSGAWHFAWNGADWLSSRGGDESLGGLLAAELTALTGRRLDLPASA